MKRFLLTGYLLAVATFAAASIQHLSGPRSAHAYAMLGSCANGSGTLCAQRTRCLRYVPNSASVGAQGASAGLICQDELTTYYHRVTRADIPPCTGSWCNTPRGAGRTWGESERGYQCNQGWCPAPGDT